MTEHRYLSIARTSWGPTNSQAVQTLRVVIDKLQQKHEEENAVRREIESSELGIPGGMLGRSKVGFCRGTAVSR